MIKSTPSPRRTARYGACLHSAAALGLKKSTWIVAGDEVGWTSALPEKACPARLFESLCNRRVRRTDCMQHDISEKSVLTRNCPDVLRFPRNRRFITVFKKGRSLCLSYFSNSHLRLGLSSGLPLKIFGQDFVQIMKRLII